MTAPVVAFTLIFYGVMFILVENYNKNRRPAVTDLNKLSYKTAFIIGLFQVPHVPALLFWAVFSLELPAMWQRNLPSSWQFQLCLVPAC